jgi:hypothetical protein
MESYFFTCSELCKANCSLQVQVRHENQDNGPAERRLSITFVKGATSLITLPVQRYIQPFHCVFLNTKKH